VRCPDVKKQDTEKVLSVSDFGRPTAREILEDITPFGDQRREVQSRFDGWHSFTLIPKEVL